MRTLEVRRHTMRRKPGQHLSQDGIELARVVGDQSDSFDLDITIPGIPEFGKSCFPEE
tara:strand:+ start:124 stop:297 length:174 start_codon:yes stop_codon:yes gene_type:complete